VKDNNLIDLPSVPQGHANHMPPSVAALLKQKLINMHVTFDLLTYCRVLLTEVRFGCKFKECMPLHTQTGGKTSMGRG